MANPTTNLAAVLPESEYDAQKVATYNAAIQRLDSAIGGRLAISTTGGTTTLTGTEAAPQAQNMFLDVSGVLASNATIEIPISATSGRNRIYVVKNGTTGAFTLTVKTVGGTGVLVTQGTRALLLYDGTNIVHVISDTANLGSSAWASWTPTWTNLTAGNGTVVAKYIQIGKLVVCRLSIVFGSTTSVSGVPLFTLPVTSVSYGGTLTTTALGLAVYFDAGVAVYEGTIVNQSTTQAALRVTGASATYATQIALSSTIPFTWGTSDEINVQFSYEAA